MASTTTTKTAAKFKPFLGRCFNLKNYIDLKKYPEVILVMDETKKDVMFLDHDGNATWISKFYLRDKPIESRVFASPDTLTEAMVLIERLRTEMIGYHAQVGTAEHNKVVKQLNKDCAQVLQELRDLGTRMIGTKFAPPVEPEASEEEASPTEAI